MDSPPPPLPVKTRRSSHAPVIVSATCHSHTHAHTPHVVSIRVNPVQQVKPVHAVPQQQPQPQSGVNTVRITICDDEMRSGSPYYFYTSGQSSPSDTLDSGTCSDLDGSTPPPLPSKKQGVTVTVNHQRGESLTSSGAEVESDDDISCDSLNSSELDNSEKHEEAQIQPVIQRERDIQEIQQRTSRVSISSEENARENCSELVRASRVFLTPESSEPCKILSEIPKESPQQTKPNPPPEVPKKPQTTPEPINHQPLEKKSSSESASSRKSVVEERTYDESRSQKESTASSLDPDSFYNFHLNENSFEPEVKSARTEEDDYFAGCKGYQEDLAASTIRSSKGTIRGVKNRVRAGIATFLQMHANKSWQEKEEGKVVVYTTTMGIVRMTYQRCLKVRQILRTHLVKFEEKDVFMSRETQQEIKERMNSEEILVPQVFIEGQYIGDAEVIERLNESGELRRILKPYKSADACTVCQVCGGYRLLPCPVCNGSKKSVHRNHFTTELVALKCMNCDQVGLVKCYAC